MTIQDYLKVCIMNDTIFIHYDDNGELVELYEGLAENVPNHLLSKVVNRIYSEYNYSLDKTKTYIKEVYPLLFIEVLN